MSRSALQAVEAALGHPLRIASGGTVIIRETADGRFLLTDQRGRVSTARTKAQAEHKAKRLFRPRKGQDMVIGTIEWHLLPKGPTP